MLEIRPEGLTEAHLVKANIGQDYWEADFGNYKGPINAKRAGITYLQKLTHMKENGIGLLLAGPNGPGKTTLVLIVMKYLIRARWDVYCTSLGEIIEDIQRGFGQNDTGDESLLKERARSADFLLIDDVGKEHRGQSGFVSTVFDNLIRYRAEHRVPTFITTNYTKSELHGTYGEAAMSLLEGKLLTIEVSGRDYRRTVLKGEMKESFKQ